MGTRVRAHGGRTHIPAHRAAVFRRVLEPHHGVDLSQRVADEVHDNAEPATRVPHELPKAVSLLAREGSARVCYPPVLEREIATTHCRTERDGRSRPPRHVYARVAVEFVRDAASAGLLPTRPRRGRATFLLAHAHVAQERGDEVRAAALLPCHEEVAHTRILLKRQPLPSERVAQRRALCGVLEHEVLARAALERFALLLEQAHHDLGGDRRARVAVRACSRVARPRGLAALELHPWIAPREAEEPENWLHPKSVAHLIEEGHHEPRDRLPAHCCAGSQKTAAASATPGRVDYPAC